MELETITSFLFLSKGTVIFFEIEINVFGFSYLHGEVEDVFQLWLKLLLQ